MPSDYRPIAIISAFCKVFERILARYIISKTQHIWRTNKQFGFLPGRSTMDAIIQVIEDWSNGKDNKNCVFALFLDFAKAFDLVNHEILLEKLVKLQLDPWLISWIAAYLTGRRQRVKIGDITSEWTKIAAGVIQGSVLGPILFILFISDFNDYLPDGVDLVKYADDILAYIIYKPLEGPGNLPHFIADGVERWCAANKMRLNTGKCKSFNILPSNAILPPVICLNRVSVEQVTSYIYLGVELNSDLNWDTQWTKVQTIISSVPYLLKRLRHLGFSTSVLTNVYRSYALSHFIYSAPLLTSASKSIKSQMSAFQNRMLRIIGIGPTDAAQPPFNIIPVEQLIDQVCVKIMNKIVSDQTHPITIKLHRGTRETRGLSNFPFQPSKANTTAYQQSFVQKFIRVLRDGAYKPDPSTKQFAINTNTTTVGANNTKQRQLKCEKPKATCQHCGKLYEAKTGLRIHQLRCRQPPL